MFLEQYGALAERRGIVSEILPHGRNQLFFITANLGCDPFETGKRVDDLHPVLAGDGVLQRRGHIGFDQTRGLCPFAGNPAKFLVFVDAVIRQQCAHLVAAEQFHFPGAVAHRRAHAITVGIRRHHDVVAAFLGESDPE